MENKKHSREIYLQVSELLFKEKSISFIPCEFPISDEEAKHIIRIAASIMMHRDGVLPGGGFVTAVCENNLNGAFNRADSTMIKALRYMVWVHQFCYVEDVISEISFDKVETI